MVDALMTEHPKPLLLKITPPVGVGVICLALLLLAAAANHGWISSSADGEIITTTPRTSVNVLDWIEAHPGLAGWVQAIGTIAAIVFAVALPMIQRRAAERAASIAARSPVTRALIAGTEAANHVRPTGPVPRQPLQRISESLRQAEQGLEDFPIHMLSPKAALAFQAMRDAFRMLVNGYNDPIMFRLGIFYLRVEFLDRVAQVRRHAHEAVEDTAAAGLGLARTRMMQEVAALEASGEPPDQHGLGGR